MLEILVLGQPLLRLDGKELLAPTRKGLALLAYLTVAGPSERALLASLLWSDLGEAEARRNLRRELHRLRETPAGDYLSGPNHLLTLQGASDLTAFRAAIAEGRLAEANRLYRGPLLDGLELSGAAGFEDWLAGERDALARERALAFTRLAAASEAGGDTDAALAAHLALLREDDLQEVHQREVMRLHALRGEREAALARYEHFARTLKDELGLEPLPETTQLAEGIRAAGPVAGHANAPAGATTEFLHPPLVGRSEPLGRMRASSAPAILLHGESGVGKSRLAEEFACERGRAVILRGQESSMLTPYYPVANALRATGSSALEALEPTWRRELARLTPELVPEQEAASGLPLPEGRAHFLEALTRALLLAAGPDGTLLLEDLHCFDPASGELAAHLTRRAPDLAPGLRLVLTARWPDLTANAPVQASVSGLLHDKLLERLELAPLAEKDVLTLVRALSGNDGAVLFSRRLHEATAGNPLFVLETIRALFASGALISQPGIGWSTPYDDSTSDYGELPLVASVRETILERVRRLGPAPRRLLEAAALAGDGFHLEQLRGATALGEWEALEALERAVDADLLREAAPGYRFAHELIRRALTASLNPERAHLLHHRLARALAEQGGDPVAVATHYEAAGRPREAAPWRERAASDAARVYAFRAALEHYRQALADGASGRDAFRIRAARTELLGLLSEQEERQGELARLNALAEEIGDPQLRAEATLAAIALANESGRYAEGLAAAEELLATGNLPPEKAALALLLAGSALLRLGRVEEAEAHLRQALEHDSPAKRRGDILVTLSAAAMQRAAYGEASELNGRALAQYEVAGDRAGIVRARMTSGVLAGLSGDRARAFALLEQSLAEGRAIGHVAHQRAALINLSKLHLDVDDYAAALPFLEAGLALAREPQDPHLEGIFLSQLGHVHRMQGNLGRAVESLERAIALAESAGAIPQAAQRRLILAELLRDLGDLPGARALLLAASEPIGAAPLKQLTAWLEIQLASCDLAEGATREASERLTRLNALAPQLQADDQAKVRWLSARLQLLQGEPENALATLDDFTGSPGLRAQAHATRLEAAAKLNLAPDSPRCDAEQLLAAGAVPPLEALELACTLSRHLEAAGEKERANHYRARGHATLERLASSLNEHPSLRARLHAAYPELNPQPALS